MAGELDSSLRDAAAKIVGYIERAAELAVETRYVQVRGDGAAASLDFDAARPAARTVISLDGDCRAVVPLRETAAGALAIDADLLELHQRNVTAAIEYRARILSALLDALQVRRR